MAEITCILVANIGRNFFFAITNTASTCFLVKKLSTNLLFATSKCHATIRRQWYLKLFKNDQSHRVIVIT